MTYQKNGVIAAVLAVFVFSIVLSASTVRIAFAQDAGYTDYSSDGSDAGYTDYSSDGSDAGYTDYSSDPGYTDYSSDPGYTDYSSDPGYTDYSSDPGYTDYSSDPGYTDYTSDCGCTEENGVEYTEETYTTSNSTPAYSQTSQAISAPSQSFSSPSRPISFSAPIVQSAPISYSQPIYQQQQQQQQQQQPIVYQQPQQQQPVVINNTNTNTNVNTNTAPVTPVYQTPVTYPVQYVFPQQTYVQPTYNYQNVSCSISANPNSIQAGQYSYLSWQSYGAISATLTNYGNVAPNGSLSIQPNGSTTYVLTVYGQNGQTATCNTYVTVSNIAPYVTLSQIPYTGFDFGEMGDAMYFAALAAFAIAAGYLMVYYKGGMVAFAGSMIPTRRQKISTKVVATATKIEEKPRVASVLEDTTSSLASLPVAESTRQTIDSMAIANHGGAPRIVISRA